MAPTELKRCVYPGEQEECPQYRQGTVGLWCLWWRDDWPEGTKESMCQCCVPIIRFGESADE